MCISRPFTFHNHVHRPHTRKQGCSVAWEHSCTVALGPCGIAALEPWCRLALGPGGKPVGEPDGIVAWALGDTAPLAPGGLLGGTVGTAAWEPGGTAALAPAWLPGVGPCGNFCGI